MDESLRRLSILYELCAGLSGSLDFDAELSNLTDQLARTLVLDAVVIFDLEGLREDGSLGARASLGLGRRTRGRIALPAATLERLRACDGLSERLLPEETGDVLPGIELLAGEAWAVRLVAEGALRGVLVVGRTLGGLATFSFDVLHALAPRLGIVLHHERLRAERRRLEEAVRGSALADLEARSELVGRMLEQKSVNVAILDAALEAIVIIDDAGRFLEFNPAAEALFGYRRQDVLGRLMGDLIVAPSLRDVHSRGMARFAETGEQRVVGRRLELPAQRADGTEFLAEIAIVRFEHAEPPQFAGFIRDVSETRRAEAALLAERARFSSVFEFAPEAVLIVDEGGRIVLANRACEPTFGYARDELVGMPVDMLVPVEHQGAHPGERARFFRHPVATPIGATRPQLQALRKDGTRIPTDITLSPFELEGRRFVVTSVRDVSKRARAEAENARLEAELRQSQKMQALGTLAGGVAHYFNNLLAAIVANVELARDHASPGTPIRESLDQVGEAAARGGDMVKQILAFSRQKPTQRAVVALAPLLDEVVRLVRHNLPPGVQLTVRVAPDAPHVSADATQLHQVLINLVTNAAHAVEKSRGAIVVDLASLVVDEASPLSPRLPPGRYARLGVSDDGVGIDAVTRDRIFEPFFTTKSVGQGTGLGLAEVHGIVTEHGGVVHVDSEPGQGTTFAILLPAVDAAPVQFAAPAPVARAVTGRVLILDDEEPLVRVGKHLLKRLGFEPTGFIHPREALEAFERDPYGFDVFITDLTMPEMSGTEVARAVSRIRPDLPIILLSGKIMDDNDALGVPNPVHRLGKPYTRELLQRTVEAALNDR